MREPCCWLWNFKDNTKWFGANLEQNRDRSQFLMHEVEHQKMCWVRKRVSETDEGCDCFPWQVGLWVCRYSVIRNRIDDHSSQKERPPNAPETSGHVQAKTLVWHSAGGHSIVAASEEKEGATQGAPYPIGSD